MATNEIAFVERVSTGAAAGMWWAPPPHPAHKDARAQRIPARQMIATRLIATRRKRCARRNGPKIRFIVFSPHRLMRKCPYRERTLLRRGIARARNYPRGTQMTRSEER